MQNKKRIEKKWFTESDLEPLTKTQLIHVIVSGVQGFEGLERTILWNHGDSCSECRSIAKQLEPQKPGAHEVFELTINELLEELGMKPLVDDPLVTTPGWRRIELEEALSKQRSVRSLLTL